MTTAPDTGRLLEVVRSQYLPQAVVLLVPDGKAGSKVRELAPFTQNYSTVDGRAAAYVCRNFECKLPTSDPPKVPELLREAREAEPGTP